MPRTHARIPKGASTDNVVILLTPEPFRRARTNVCSRPDDMTNVVRLRDVKSEQKAALVPIRPGGKALSVPDLQAVIARCQNEQDINGAIREMYKTFVAMGL